MQLLIDDSPLVGLTAMRADYDGNARNALNFMVVDGWWGRPDRVPLAWTSSGDPESGVASYEASLVQEHGDGSTNVTARVAVGCAATNATLSRQLHHGARYHLSLVGTNGVGLNAA